MNTAKDTPEQSETMSYGEEAHKWS